MELSLKELNDLYYCVGKMKSFEVKLIDDDSLDKLMDRLFDEIIKNNEN